MSTKKGTRLTKGQAPPAATKVSSTRSSKARGKRARDESEDEETSFSSDSSEYGGKGVVEEPKSKIAKITGSSSAAKRKAPTTPPPSKTKKNETKRAAPKRRDESEDEDDSEGDSDVDVRNKNKSQKKAAPTKGKDGKKKTKANDDDEEEQQVAKPNARARAQPKRLEKEEEGEKEEEEEDDEQAVPKTPQIERAKAICMSAKRHLARPLDETAAVDLTVVPQTPRISKLRGSEVVAKSDYDELLERFNQLKGLRTTKAEKMYQKHLATTEAREKATAKFIENLKIENRRLHEQLASSAAKQEKKDRESKNERVEEEAKHRQADKQQLERANATLQFLRQLTLIDAKPHPEEGATAFLCSCKNPNDKRALAFVLTTTEDSVEYKPIEIGKQPNWEINEMFVKEIYFGPQFAPIFLSKLLATVYGTKKKAAK